MALRCAATFCGGAVLLLCCCATAAAADPTYCASWISEPYQCNCASCNCQTCHNCGCRVKTIQWTDCDYGDCTPNTCWCASVGCKCCYTDSCAYTCNCQQCCDTCYRQVCSSTVTYHVAAVSPPAVPYGTASVVLTGGTFTNSGSMLCRFTPLGGLPSDAVQTAGTMLSSVEVSCALPAAWSAQAARTTATFGVALSLDGVAWTSNNVTLAVYRCTSDCNGHGLCGPDYTCACDAMWSGARCSRLCPTGPGGAVCSDNGWCITAGGCSCAPGYWGRACENACGCVHGACAPNGQCVCEANYVGAKCDKSGACKMTSENCTCTGGTFGTACASACPTSGCNGMCASDNVCACAAGFYGPTCSLTCPSAGGSVGCGGNGYCLSDGTCACTNAHFGAACQYVCPGPPGAACSGHGNCTEDGRCVCSTGYGMPDCGTACPTSGGGAPCGGVGVCNAADATCTCSAGYYGPGCGGVCPGGVATPCSLHGVCDAVTGQCSCARGFWGPQCASECPGGAATPCSQHGQCSSKGTCACDAAHWGPACAGACPLGSGGRPCSGNGTCNQATGVCECDATYTGPACAQRTCLYDCYNNGVCNNGACVCFPDWTDPQCGTPKLARAVFAFALVDITVPETAGLILVNVTRIAISGGAGGVGVGANTDVWVSYAATPRTAAPDLDYVCPPGQLRWAAGDFSPKSIQVEILPGPGTDPTESFTIGLFGPSYGSMVGAANATVSIIGGASYANDAADVSIDLLLPPGALPPDFGTRFVADLAAALGVGAARFSLMSVSGYGGVTVVVVRMLPNGAGAAAGPTAVGLYLQLKNDVANPSSAIWAAGSLTRSIDPTYPPTAVFLALPPAPAPPPPPPPPGMSWQSVLLIVLGVGALAAGAAAWWRRKALTEWVLWRLASFRFTTLRDHADEPEGVELEPPTSAA